ncbi:hypothetical protein [Sporisorium scitamineum]|nr:hypothetical protein [Sporisorium scitamineum]
MILEGICRANDVSILAIDRPGSGGTRICPLQDRIRIATQQTLSVLEALQLDRLSQPRIGLVSHSAGWVYALALLEAAPGFFARSGSPTRCVFSSPFIPTSVFSSLTLSLLPKGLVALTPKVLPVVSRTLGWSTGVAEDILDISKGLFSFRDAELDPRLSEEQQRLQRDRLEKKNRDKREASKRKNPQARFHPPYTPHLKFALDAWKTPPPPPTLPQSENRPRHPKTNRPLKSGADLLFDYVIEEGSLEGMAEDYLLCLGKAPGLDNGELTGWLLSKLKGSFEGSVRVCGKRVEVVVLWGGEDFMIPRKGREWLDEVLKGEDLAGAVRYQQWEMAEGGHDATIFSEDVMLDVLEFLTKDS